LKSKQEFDMANPKLIQKVIQFLDLEDSGEVLLVLSADGQKVFALRLAQLKADLESATTVDDCLQVWVNCPRGSALGKQAFEKALSFANVFTECMHIHDNVLEHASEEGVALAKAMSLASTPDEWRTCIEHVYAGSDEAATCIRAIAALLEKEQASA
jgi:hypothetical protein